MMGPRRLLDQPGPAARLLRAGDTHVPSERARRAALLAAGSAAATLAASGSSAAAGGGALLKSVLAWLAAGALGGAAITVVATSALPRQTPIARGSKATPFESAARATRRLDSVPPSVLSAQESEPVAPTPALDAARPPIGAPSARGLGAPGGVAPEPDEAHAASASSVGRFASDERATPSLYDQLRLIDEARSAVARRDTAAALSALDRYDRVYPRGQFLPESLALRIEAVARGGDTARARALAARFRQAYPQHPLSSRVAAALGD